MAANTRGEPAAAASPDLLDLLTDRRVQRLHPGRTPVAGSTGLSRRVQAAAIGIAAAAIVLPAATVRFGPARTASFQLLVPIPGRVIPVAELPPVEPVEIRSLAPDDARAFNATVPFSTAANPPARPFHPAGSPDDLARATDCLAAAVYYEAGEDPDGQRAVAQVVLNRVRHPAFPKTVCGVVFQGSERPTGCQFTFTCDGSLLRYTPTPDGWIRARKIAAAALAGGVDRAVGYATHYHTDWVVPYWQASLDKIVAVHTQLFYRWSGWWGTSPAFNRHAEATEPAVPALARLSDAHRVGAGAEVGIAAATDVAGVAGAADAPGTAAAAGVAAVTNEAASVGNASGQFLVTLPAGLPPARWPELATRLCAARERCSVMAWRTKAATATSVPLEVSQIAAMQFSYLRDRAFGFERSLWNCTEAPRADPHQCMKRQVSLPGFPIRADGKPSAGPAPMPGTGSADLPGVRRKEQADTHGPGPAIKPVPLSEADARTGIGTGRGTDRPRPVTPPGTSPAAAP